jgi:hypothetical protein
MPMHTVQFEKVLSLPETRLSERGGDRFRVRRHPPRAGIRRTKPKVH